MNPRHLELLGQGADVWNRHRQQTGEAADLPGAVVSALRLYNADLRGSNFEGAHLSGAQVMGSDLSGSNLRNVFAPASEFSGCNFSNTDLRGAKFFRSMLDVIDLRGAQLDGETDLSMCNLAVAKLSGVNASGVNFSFSSLSCADLTNADLSGCDLSQTNLVHADVEGSRFTGARIHGIAAWDLSGTPADESNLVIVKQDASVVTVDDLEVAQMVYLMLNNAKLEDLIDTVTTKTVLILGRFKDDRKEILDAIRDRLKQENYVGVIFDFDPSENRDLTETVSTLAHMSRFIIADITEARSIPQELKHIVPLLPSVPVQPIVHRSDTEWAMFNDLRRFGTILPIFTYDSRDHLMDQFRANLIQPATDWFAKKGTPSDADKIAALLAENERLQRELKAAQQANRAQA